MIVTPPESHSFSLQIRPPAQSNGKPAPREWCKQLVAQPELEILGAPWELRLSVPAAPEALPGRLQNGYFHGFYTEVEYG